MDTPDILTFTAPQAEVPHVDAAPSPTLELAYAYYAVMRPDSREHADELSWVGALYAGNPKLIEDLKAFYPDTDPHEVGFDLFAIVCEMGYARDSDVKRFLADLPDLPERFIAHQNTIRKRLRADVSNEKQRKERRQLDGLISRLALLSASRTRKRFIGLIHQLWDHLEPSWKAEGERAVLRACETFQTRYQETGNVLDGLPAHHFTQFESFTQFIQVSQEKGKLLIVPLYFAAAGGFNFDFADGHYIGFGLQSELLFEQLSTQVDSAAMTMKALSDPTRLMLLTLIARYAHFEMTVGDFAAQLNVTQPTVSGHLKLLREAKLVMLEKKGNKSYYTVNADALRSGLEGLGKLVLK
jgi:DNA-binding transcriptional ArsR family regulator